MIPSVAAAIIGICLILLFTFGLTRLQPRSGDAIIQPEGEPDPGVPDGPGRPKY